MASIIVAGDAEAGDVLQGHKFCAGILYNVDGTLVSGGAAMPTVTVNTTLILIYTTNVGATAPTVPTATVEAVTI